MCKYIGFELVELASKIRDDKRDLRVLVAKELDYSRETACPSALSAALAVLRRSGDTEALRVLLEAEGAERAGPGVIDRTERAVREEVRG
jgi:hypothetical protein